MVKQANKLILIAALKIKIKQERIPFDVESERQAVITRGKEALERIRANAILNGTADMSMEELNEEIRLYREEKRRKRNAEEGNL